MATARLPVLRVDTYEDALPIVLIPPSDDALTASPRAGTPSEAEAKMLRARNRSPKSPALHPIRSMQEAFNESLIEATMDASLNKPKLRHLDAKARREHLIAQEKGEELYGMRWRYRPGQTQHELCKLMSQISFGMNLLLTGKANSDDQVVSIIQGHIDEIDEFLDVALEDFQQATADLTERIKYLRLPLEHLDVFEKLLEDRNYRAELLHNNENIDHILSRTMSMLTQYESDFAKGLRSTKDFISYLTEQRDSPRRTQYPDIDDIYKAMKGNTDGWRIAFLDLQQQGINLDGLSTKLSTMVATIQSKAGEVSRRTWTKIEPFSLPRVNSIRASQQTSPASSTSPSVMSTRSPTSSNSISESITPTHAPLDAIRFNRLTISAALGPALENPFEDLKFITHQGNDAIADDLVPDDNGDVTVDRGEDILSISLGEARGAATNDHGGVYDRDQDLGVQSEVGVHMCQTVEDMAGQEPATGVKNEPLLCEVEEEQEAEEEEEEVVVVRADVKEETKDDAYGDLYLLQPRTYTPRLPAPLPSPAVKEYKPPVTSQTATAITISPVPLQATAVASAEPQPSSIPDFPKRSSLRQRVSLKGNAPPESIKIPPPMRSTPQLRPSPNLATLPDSAYGSDNDLRHRASAIHLPEPSPPILNRTMPSPLSDRQVYHPVQASPHSPLQQRPHTSYNAFPTPPRTSHTFQPGHTRNAPSRLGGASTLSKVTTLTYDTATSKGGSGDKRLKKKKSAFGWLKKAFALDEDEKAAFEARKVTQDQNLYYQERSKKFLDGRRVRTPNQQGRDSPASTYQGSMYQASNYEASTYQTSMYRPQSPYQHSPHQQSLYHGSQGYQSPGYQGYQGHQ